MLIGLAIGGLLIVSIVGVVFYQDYARKRDAEAKRNFENRAKGLAAKLDFKDRSYNSAYLKGKVAVFNLDENAFDISHNGIPAGLRAATEEELATLVTVKCNQELEAFYYRREDVSSAWGKKCSVKVIDLSTQEIVGHKEIYGYAPPLQDKKKGEGFEAKHPDDQIISYLTTLPRK